MLCIQIYIRIWDYEYILTHAIALDQDTIGNSKCEDFKECIYRTNYIMGILTMSVMSWSALEEYKFLFPSKLVTGMMWG